MNLPKVRTNQEIISQFYPDSYERESSYIFNFIIIFLIVTLPILCVLICFYSVKTGV